MPSTSHGFRSWTCSRRPWSPHTPKWSPARHASTGAPWGAGGAPPCTRRGVQPGWSEPARPAGPPSQMHGAAAGACARPGTGCGHRE
eukprot:8578000-Pyramimonas_sp.AAC.1